MHEINVTVPSAWLDRRRHVVQEDDFRPSRPELLRSMAVLLVSVACTYIVIWCCVLDLWAAGSVTGLAALGGMFLPAVYRWTGSCTAAAHSHACLVFTVLVVLIAMTGGSDSPVFMWLPIVPVAAMILGGPRVGIVWLGAVLIEAVLIELIDPRALGITHILSPKAVSVLNTSSVMALSVSVFVALYMDYRALTQAHEQLSHQATHDGLTGLLNHRAVVSHLDGASARPGAHCAVIMVDIDFFKLVNDRYGHAAGDLALQEVAHRIRRCVRATDLVGRYGGEEFLCVLPNCTLPQAVKIAEEIREHVEEMPIDLGDLQLPVTVSLGVATCSSAGDESGRIVLQRADAALYEAKRNGRNQTRAAGLRHAPCAAV